MYNGLFRVWLTSHKCVSPLNPSHTEEIPALINCNTVIKVKIVQIIWSPNSFILIINLFVYPKLWPNFVRKKRKFWIYFDWEENEMDLYVLDNIGQKKGLSTTWLSRHGTPLAVSVIVSFTSKVYCWIFNFFL